MKTVADRAFTLQLGDSLDLLAGLHPGWAGGLGGAPFAVLEHRAFRSFACLAPLERGAWSAPEISFHDDAASLIDNLFDYQVQPLAGHEGRFEAPVSSLMLRQEQRPAALAALSRLLGLPIGVIERGGLVLLRCRREDAVHRYEVAENGSIPHGMLERYWTCEGRYAVGRLCALEPQRGALASRQHDLQRYADHLHRYGTHFVSHVALGDQVYQVIACHAKRYGLLKALWRQMAPLDPLQAAVAFNTYMGREWMAGYGRIASAAADPALSSLKEVGVWHDAAHEVKENLLLPWLESAEQGVSPLHACTQNAVVGMRLTQHSPYMDERHAGIWERTFQGALIQQYGDSIRMPFPARTYTAISGPVSQDDEMLVCATPDGVLACGDTIRLDAAFQARLGKADTLYLLARRIVVPAEGAVALPGTRIIWLAFEVDAAGTDDCVPAVSLASASLDDFLCLAARVRGAIRLVAADGRQRTLFEDLQFDTDAQGLILVKPVTQVYAAAVLAAVRAPLAGLLADAEARLVQSVAVHRTEAEQAARLDLNWLAGLLHDTHIAAIDETHRPFWESMQRRACFLAAFGPFLDRGHDVTVNATMRVASGLLQRQRALAQGAEPVADAAYESLIQALRHASEALVPRVLAKRTDSAELLLSHCLRQVGVARERTKQALRHYQQQAQAWGIIHAPWEPASFLRDVLAWHWRVPSIPEGACRQTAHPGLAKAASLLGDAEQIRVQARLLVALLGHEAHVGMDAVRDELGGSHAIAMPVHAWETMSSIWSTWLDEQGDHRLSAAALSLSDAFQAFAKAGARLSALVRMARHELHRRYRENWHVALDIPDAATGRVYQYVRYLRLQLIEAQSTLPREMHEVASDMLP